MKADFVKGETFQRILFHNGFDKSDYPLPLSQGVIFFKTFTNFI